MKTELALNQMSPKYATTCGKENIVQGPLCDKHYSNISQAIQISSRVQYANFVCDI